MIIVNFNGLLMDDSWGDPEEFRPERFIDDSGKISVRYKYFPFSIGMILYNKIPLKSEIYQFKMNLFLNAEIGRHRCMGETLARSNLFIMTSALLQRFTFSVVPGEQRPSTLDFVDGVTAGIKPFKVLISTRT